MELNLPVICDGEDKSSPFKNRLRNNYKHLRKWAKRSATNAFRLYEREVKGYPFIIDLYSNRFCVQFVAKSADILEPAPLLKKEVEKSLQELFAVPIHHIYWKTRKRRQHLEQYEKVDSAQDFFPVVEYGLHFRVNLQDYLDTGLFLDHRETRHLVGTMSRGKRLLNLFAYTCSFSVHAAAGGALSTKSVDLSNTYTTWGRDNFELNGFPPDRHEILREDCLQFMAKEVKRGGRYDLIVIDPPTISRSKKMERKFDVQIDHTFLVQSAIKLLSPGGTLFFSTNSRKFSLDKSLGEKNRILEITPKTIPLDFRNKKIHRCWKISLF